MKELSLFLLKNSLGAKMRRGMRTLCNGDDSTSTLKQQDDEKSSRLPTLEEMILQLEMEEEAGRKEQLGRMSSVNNSDILRSARNALNQYPRFSLDGKDAMYRSSFKTVQARNSVCCERGLRRSFCGGDNYDLPPKVAGERVVWCKPGVVAKLMGLEAMPVPILGGKNKLMKRHQSLWRSGDINIRKGRGRRSASCSRTETHDYYVVNPVAVVDHATPACPTTRFL